MNMKGRVFNKHCKFVHNGLSQVVAATWHISTLIRSVKSDSKKVPHQDSETQSTKAALQACSILPTRRVNFYER